MIGLRNAHKSAAIFLYFLINVCTFSSQEFDDDDVVVSVTEGYLRGTVQRTKDGRTYFAFLGVPYGTSDRFEAPVPFPKWDGIRNATEYGPVCPQLAPGRSTTVIGQEECQSLTIFTHNLSGNSPVIVYIHGGALMTGSGSLYGGAYFMNQYEEKVILVTIQYRIGALGFLSTEDGVIQGNFGLKDQSMALRWIRDNIASFGGDPSRVTLMGESAGSASVAYHLLSPMSKGLFHGAIMQSGSALDPQHFHPNPMERTMDLAESLDCPTFPTYDMAKCLRMVDFRKIVQIKLIKWHLDPLTQYPPVQEKLRPDQSPSEVFLHEDPTRILEEGRFNKVPVVIGVTQEEGLLFHSAYILRNLELQRNMNEDWNYVAPITLYYANQNIPSSEVDQISRTIRGFYFGNRKVEPETSRNLTNLYSDRLFNWGARKTAMIMARWVPVYAYIFGFMGDFSMLQVYYGDLFQEPIGVSHGDDLQYFFNSSRYPDLKTGSQAEEISKALVKLWTSFASTGNMLRSLETLKVAWLPIGPDEIKRRRIKWCLIDIHSKVLVREPFTERMEFWDKISNQLQTLISSKDDTQNNETNAELTGNKDEL